MSTIKIVEDCIICVQPDELPTCQSINESFRKIAELTGNWQKVHFLVIFPKQMQVSSETSRLLREKLTPLGERLVHTALVFESDLVRANTIKYIEGSIPFTKLSVHGSTQRAIDRLREEKAKHANNIAHHIIQGLPDFPKLENLPYGPESSLEQVKTLQARVCFLDHNVVYFRELPVHSVFQLDTMFGHLSCSTKNLDEWYLIIDLTEASQPSAEIRAHIKKKLDELKNPKLVVLVINNFLIRLAARFVMGNTFKTPHTIVDSVKQALERIGDHKGHDEKSNSNRQWR